MATVLVSNALMLPVVAKNVPNTKEEVVYVILEEDGTVQDVYVVNNVVVKDGKVLDYGEYRTLRNLNTEDKIIQQEEQITIETDSERVYYEGLLDTYELPWKLEILYMLNGEMIEAEELAGKDGMLTISIAVEENKEANPSFYENYALQIATTLDTNKCSEIQTQGGTVATVGENKNIVYTHTPNQAATYRITTTVKDFEMAPISINAIPFTINRDLSELVNIEEYMGPLQEGITQLDNSVVDLHTGAKELLGAMELLEDNTPSLVNGSTKVKEALVQVQNGLGQIQQLTAANGPIVALQKGSTAYLKGVQEIASKIEPLVGASDKIYEGLKSGEQMLGALATDTEETQNLLNALKEMDHPQVNVLLTLYSQKMGAVAEVSKQMGGLTEKYSLFAAQMNALSTAVGTLASQYTEIDKGIANLTSSLSSLETLNQALASLISQYNTLHTGLVNYTGSFEKILSGYKCLNEGITLVSEATSAMQEKTASLGANETKTSTSYIPESFVSKENTEVTSVQFVMKTQEIKKEEAEEGVMEPSQKLSFWEKLKNLFTKDSKMPR